MNIRSDANQCLLLQSKSKMIPQHSQFDFEQWASAVRQQMKPVVNKRLILPPTARESQSKQG